MQRKQSGSDCLRRRWTNHHESCCRFPFLKIDQQWHRLESAAICFDCEFPGRYHREHQFAVRRGQNLLYPLWQMARVIVPPEISVGIEQIFHSTLPSGSSVLSSSGRIGPSNIKPKPYSTNSLSVRGSNAVSSAWISPWNCPPTRFPGEGASIGTIFATGFLPRVTMTSLPASASLSRREKCVLASWTV